MLFVSTAYIIWYLESISMVLSVYLIFVFIASFCLNIVCYGNSFGKLFRITTFGESHGKAIGVTIDGCPPRFPISIDDIQHDLDRRKPGQSRLTTQRKESDELHIISGIENGLTTGTPLTFLVYNKDQRSEDYEHMTDLYRPSHADATYDAKYGLRSVAGGGRASARETIGRVAAGAVARKVLSYYCGMQIVGYVKSVQDIEANVDSDTVTTEMVDENIMRCPDIEIAKQMISRVDNIRRTGDSVGGTVEVVARKVPSGLGAPVFDKLEAQLAQACLSIPAAKGFEIGSGFGGTLLTGKEHNDEFQLDDNRRIRTASNRSGGVQGGISNGENILLRVAFKPTATIGKMQRTVTSSDTQEIIMRARGRHDPCVLPRAVPIVESMVAIVLLDSLLCHHGQCELFPRQERFKVKLGQVLRSPEIL